MRKILFILIVSIACIGCNNNTNDVVDNRISLRTDTINVVKLSDTLVIYQSTCRGCEYEKSTNFAISDSMNMIRLANIVTTDDSPPNMDGGSINKDLVIVSQKTGTTIIKLYKFWTRKKTAEDSARFTSYKIEVKQ